MPAVLYLQCVYTRSVLSSFPWLVKFMTPAASLYPSSSTALTPIGVAVDVPAQTILLIPLSLLVDKSKLIKSFTVIHFDTKRTSPSCQPSLIYNKLLLFRHFGERTLCRHTSRLNISIWTRQVELCNRYCKTIHLYLQYIGFRNVIDSLPSLSFSDQ